MVVLPARRSDLHVVDEDLGIGEDILGLRIALWLVLKTGVGDCPVLPLRLFVDLPKLLSCGLNCANVFSALKVKAHRDNPRMARNKQGPRGHIWRRQRLGRHAPVVVLGIETAIRIMNIIVARTQTGVPTLRTHDPHSRTIAIALFSFGGDVGSGLLGGDGG